MWATGTLPLERVENLARGFEGCEVGSLNLEPRFLTQVDVSTPRKEWCRPFVNFNLLLREHLLVGVGTRRIFSSFFLSSPMVDLSFAPHPTVLLVDCSQCRRIRSLVFLEPKSSQCPHGLQYCSCLPFPWFPALPWPWVGGSIVSCASSIR